MPIHPDQFQTGGALQSAVAASLVREREAAAALRAGDEVGNFRVLRELGRGGMAVVYLAERSDGEYEQRIALKWMQAGQVGDAGEALFRRERQALADLAHPHIARLLDGGRGAQGQPWLAMEYIDGPPLDAHCIAAALPLRPRLQRFGEVCSAVAFAHAHGVLHRDIKPSNVLVDARGGAKLLDFGIAQLMGGDDALAARAFTPGFASPEQMAGEALTAASDVYQLGRLLAAVLSQDAGERETLVTRVQAASGDAPAVGVPANLPADLAAILAVACHLDPSRRYATVDALAADVRAFLEHRPVAARPRTAGYLAKRFVQRHPVAVTASAATLVVMLAASTAFVVRLRAERDAADHQAKVATTVLDFMRQDLLAAADPSAAPGQELSVRAALDLASASVGARFADLPVEQAAIRDTLAGLYNELGRLEEAEREARQAIALAGENAVQRRAALGSLASVLVARDRLDEAEALLATLHAEHAEASGPDARATLATASLQGVVLHRHGEYERARQLHQEVLERATRRFGPDDALALNAAFHLAVDLQMLGHHDDAEPLLRQVVAHRRETFGERHPATLSAMHGLGVLLRHRGEPDAAMALLEPTLAARREVLGPAHPETLISANETATAHQDMKRFAQAEPLFREVLDQRLRVLGETHLFTRNSMSNLGLLYSLWGRLEQAAPLYERALEIETGLIGENHPDTIALIHNIAGLYRKQGRLDEALAMHARALAAAEASPDLGPEAWQTALFRAGQAQTLQLMQRHDESDAAMRHCIRTLENTLGPDHPRTLRARQMQAELKNARGGAGQRKT